MITLKICSRCSRPQPLTHFNQHGPGKPFKPHCRSCTAKETASRNYPKRTPNDLDIENTYYYEGKISAGSERTGPLMAARRTVEAAQLELLRVLVEEAIAVGFIERPDACQGCQSRSRKLQPHHANVRDVLDFKWFCPKCL
jgi:hypothetical protein